MSVTTVIYCLVILVITTVLADSNNTGASTACQEWQTGNTSTMTEVRYFCSILVALVLIVDPFL